MGIPKATPIEALLGADELYCEELNQEYIDDCCNSDYIKQKTQN
jgi:hypothetical protein